MNVPCMAHAAKPVGTPTGHTDVAAQKGTSCSLTGYLAKPDKVSCIIFTVNKIICMACRFHFLIINRAVFVKSKWDTSYSPIRVHWLHRED